MNIRIIKFGIGPLLAVLLLWGCKVPQATSRTAQTALPARYNNSSDSSNSIANMKWQQYFTDPNLIALIDTALKNNQEFNIVLQEIEIAKNEARARKGEYLPFVGLKAGADYEKEGGYTSGEAIKENINADEKRDVVNSDGNYLIGAFASWEVDIWKKLRNAQQSAVLHYLSTQEGRNFMQTNLVAEIANSYYELMALDNMQNIIQQNITIQDNALNVVKQQKEAAKTTQLAVNRFEAQLLHTKNLQYDVRQRQTELTNRINFLVGRYPQDIQRNSSDYWSLTVDAWKAGVPSQLLSHRPDIRGAELDLEAANLDIKVAKANFYPSLSLQAGVGFKAFKPGFLINPESIVYSIAGDIVAPLVNRNAIKAAYSTANAKQIQAVFAYEQSILNASVEVLNQLSKAEQFAHSYEAKEKEVGILQSSVNIANSLFRAARADYLEILTTQREALESKMELIEVKQKQLNARVDLYRSVGGGWN